MFFSFSLAPDKLKMVLKFLANLYQEKPLEYDPKILEGERDVIQKERQGYENNPAWALGFKIGEFFKGKEHYSSKNSHSAPFGRKFIKTFQMQLQNTDQSFGGRLNIN
ncbi:MAG: hypothetical protein EBR67_08635, partial [Proteobacteria bacterium]|nr:hypothetical protein [Pseudomonadota bacterium]